MHTCRAGWALAVPGLLVLAGCVTLAEYNTVARANLQLQDQLDVTQADRVKARTQIALLRQEVVQARQAEQAAGKRADNLEQQVNALKARLELQGRLGQAPDGPAAQELAGGSQPAAGEQTAGSQALSQQVSRLQRENAALQRQLQEIRTLLEDARTRLHSPVPATRPGG